MTFEAASLSPAGCPLGGAAAPFPSSANDKLLPPNASSKEIPWSPADGTDESREDTDPNASSKDKGLVFVVVCVAILPF